MRHVSEEDNNCKGSQDLTPSNFNLSKFSKLREVKFFKNPSHPIESSEPCGSLSESSKSSLLGSMIFEFSVRLAIYCLLLQSILPCFAWAASAEVQSQPLELPKHLDRPVEPRFIYLPQIHQELKITKGKPEEKSEVVKPAQAYSIDRSDIEASIAKLGSIYTGLRQVGKGLNFEWSAHGLLFTYTPGLTTDDLHIEGKQGAPAGSTLKIDKIKGGSPAKSDMGKIVIEQGLQLDSLIAPSTHVENRGAKTIIKNLVARYFSQQEGFSLTTQRLTCSGGFGNAGVLASSGNLYLDISGKALNSGAIKAHTLEGKIQELDNSGLVEAEFKSLSVANLQNQLRGNIKGGGTLRVGRGNNDGSIKSTSLTLDLYQDGSEFLNNGLIASQETFATLGRGLLREGKSSRIEALHLRINNRSYERAHDPERKDDPYKYTTVTVGRDVQRWINHEGSTLSATRMEFLASPEAKEGSLGNSGTFLVDQLINHAAHFKNVGDMHLGTWEQKGARFHSGEHASIEVRGATTLNMDNLINDGDINIHDTLSGLVTRLENKGGLTVDRDLRIQGNALVNNKNIYVKGILKWDGRILTNSGLLRMGFCDIAAWYQFINSGTFLWTHYTLRAAHVINLGWMEQTRDLEQKSRTDPHQAQEKLRTENLTYKRFAVDNRGTLRLQTDYVPERAVHQRTGVKFKEWYNSGTFLDKGRHLKADIFNNTGDYRTDGVLAGRVINFTSTGKLYAGKVDLTSERVKLSGLFESKGKVSIHTERFEDDTKLKMTAHELVLSSQDGTPPQDTPLTLAGDIQVVKDLILKAYKAKITGKITQQTGKATFEGRQLTLASNGELNVDKFHFAGRPIDYSIYNWWLIKNTLTLEGKFMAGQFSADNIDVLNHASPHPLALQGTGYTYIPSVKITGTGNVCLGKGQYSFGNFSSESPSRDSLCEILGNVKITRIANNNRLHLKKNATLRMTEGKSGIIEAPTGVSLFLPGNEAKEQETKGTKVVCLSDQVTVPTLHTQSESIVYLHPLQNAAVFIRDELDRQGYPQETPLTVYGSLFSSIGNLTYPKPLSLRVGEFYNNHELNFGPSRIHSDKFRNGTSTSQRGSIRFTGESEIKVTHNLDNQWGSITAVHPENQWDRYIFPGNLTLISETEDILIGTTTPSYSSTGSFAAASGKLRLWSQQRDILISYADLATGPELKDVTAGDLELEAKRTVQTRTANLNIAGGATINAQTFNFCGGEIYSAVIGQKPIFESVNFLVDGRDGATFRMPPGCYRPTGRYENITENQCRSDGSVLNALKNVVVKIQAGKCEGSKILTPKKVLINGKDINLRRGECKEFSIVDNPGSNHNPLRKAEVIGGKGVSVNTTRFNFNGGHMAGPVVVIIGGTVVLIGGQGGRAGVPHIRDCELSRFLTALGPAFDSVHDRSALWSHPVLVITGEQKAAPSSRPQLPAPRTTDRNIDMSQGEAAFAVMGAEIDQYGRPLPLDLMGSQRLNQYAQRGIEVAGLLQRTTGRELVARDLQQSLTGPVAYALDTGVLPYILHLIMPAAKSGARRHIEGDRVSVTASQDLFLMDLSIHGEQELKLASQGSIRATVGVDKVLSFTEDGWLTELTVHRQNNQITGKIIELKAKGAIALLDTDIDSSGSLLIASDEGAIEITGSMDEEKATRSQSTGLRLQDDYFGSFDHHAQAEHKTAQHMRQVQVHAKDGIRMETPASLVFTGVKLTTPMEITLKGQDVIVKAGTKEYTYTRESISESGSRLRERYYRDTRSERSSEKIPGPFSEINAGTLTVIAQVLDLVGVQASLGVFNDRTQVFKLRPAIAERKSEAQESHFHSSRGPVGIGKRTQRGSASITEEVSQPQRSSLKTQESHLLGLPGVPGGKVHIVSSEFVAPQITVGKDVSLESVPSTKKSNSSSSSQRMNPMSIPLLPKPASSSFDGGNILDRLAGRIEGVTSILQSVNQAFGVLRGQVNPLIFVTRQLANISWSQQEQKSRVLESQDVPSVVHWGVTTFKGSTALHIKGYLTIDSIESGSLRTLTSEPLRSEHRVEVEGSSSNSSINPISLSFSWGEQEFKRLQSAIEFTNSNLTIGGGRLVVDGDADFFGINVEGKNATIAVGGNETLRSAVSTYEERFEESHSSFSLTLGALLPGLSWGLGSLPTVLGSGAAIGPNSLSLLDVAAAVGGSGIGDSVRERKERVAIPSTIETASGSRHSESWREVSESESSSVFGSVLRLAGSGLSLGMAARELSGHVIALTTIKSEAREALQQAGVSEQEAKEIVADPEIEKDLEALTHVQDLLEAPVGSREAKSVEGKTQRVERRESVLSEPELQQWAQAFVASVGAEQDQKLSASQARRNGIVLARKMREEYSYQRSLGLDDQQAWTNVRFKLIETQEYMQSQPQYREVVWPWIAQGVAKASPYVARGASAVKTGTAALFAKLGKMISSKLGRGLHPALPKDTPKSAWKPPKKGCLDKIPQELHGKGQVINTDKSKGFLWSDGEKGNNYIRIMKGDPKAEHISQHVDYVRLVRNGQVIGRDGKPIIKETIPGLKPRKNPEAHIPLSEWVSWPEWFRP